MRMKMNHEPWQILRAIMHAEYVKLPEALNIIRDILENGDEERLRHYEEVFDIMEGRIIPANQEELEKVYKCSSYAHPTKERLVEMKDLYHSIAHFINFGNSDCCAAFENILVTIDPILGKAYIEAMLEYGHGEYGTIPRASLIFKYYDAILEKFKISGGRVFEQINYK